MKRVWIHRLETGLVLRRIARTVPLRSMGFSAKRLPEEGPEVWALDLAPELR